MGASKGVDSGKPSTTPASDEAFNADVIFGHLGKFGKYQWRFWFLMGFVNIFPASAVLVYTFSGYVPPYRYVSVSAAIPVL